MEGFLWTGVTVKVYVVDLASETLDPAPHTVRAYFTQYVSEFKNLVAQRTGLPAGQMRCVLERYAKELKLLSVSNKTLKAEGFVRSNKVFIECSGTEDDRTANFTHTKFFHILDRYENTIRVHVTLPPFKTVETYINATGVTSVAKPNQDTPSDNGKNGQDLDEGIGESESDSRLAPESPPDGAKGDGSVVGGTVATRPLSPQDGATGDGPVKSVSRDNDAIHSYLGGAIQRELSTDHSESGNESAQSSHSSSQQTSPEENAKEFASGREILSGENWETEDVYQCLSGNDAEHRRSFTASMHIDTETSGRSLTVCVDERISLGAFKQELEHYVGVPADMFRIYRVYGNSQEIETVRLTDNLSCFGDDSKMTVKFGRALKKGEHRVKVYQLHPNQSETCKFLLETIFHKSMNVLESKEKIVDELQRHCQMTVPVDRLRLRKKTCKSPGKIYLDRQKHEDQMMTSWEIFMEVLDGPEQATSLAQLAIYIRQWRPSLYEIGSLEEVVLNKQTVQELKEVISSRTDIPVECVEIAKGRGTFPCEVGVLTAQTELDWNPDAVSLNSWPLHIYEDGNVVYYRDSREKLMELSDEKKKELQQKENSRLPKTGSLYSYSIRKEKALKIYTDQPSSQKSSEASSKKVLIY